MIGKKTPLERAKKALKAHNFPLVIKILEPLVIDYRDSFDFYFMLGTACLYVGDLGGSEMYYKRARSIKMMNVSLLNAQAVLFLRREQVDRAVEYFLEAQEYEPSNKIAKRGLAFIRAHNNQDALHKAVLNNRLKKLYPLSGTAPRFLKPLCGVAVFLLSFSIGLYFFLPYVLPSSELRADLSDLVLTVDDKKNSLEKNLATANYRCILTADEIQESYKKAQSYFQNYRDNAAQVEVNRILNSNASAAVRQKARLLMEYFETPSFDTIVDSYDYNKIKKESWLYMDCYVVWSGRVSNAKQTEEYYSCDFLIGYEDMRQVDGIVPLVLKQPVVIDTIQPLTILAKIGIQNGRLFLSGVSVYQPLATKK